MLFEQGPLPNPASSSKDWTRFIRYPYGDFDGYASMVGEAYAAWDRLWADLGTVHYVETGTLIVLREDDPWVEASCAGLDDLQIPYSRLGPTEIANSYPFLRTDGETQAIHTPTGGLLLASSILTALTDWLRAQAHADVRANTAVDAIDLRRGTLESAGTVDLFDQIVVAAGPWTTDLIDGLQGTLTPSRQVVCDLDVDPNLQAAWERAPIVLDGIFTEHRGAYIAPPRGTLAMKLGDHSFSLKGHPDADRTPTEAEEQALWALATETLLEPERYRVRGFRTCFYTMTNDSRFRLDFHTAGLVLSGFSGHGFKFGPLIGRLVAETVAGTVAPARAARWVAGHRDARPEMLHA